MAEPPDAPDQFVHPARIAACEPDAAAAIAAAGYQHRFWVIPRAQPRMPTDLTPPSFPKSLLTSNLLE